MPTFIGRPEFNERRIRQIGATLKRLRRDLKNTAELIELYEQEISDRTAARKEQAYGGRFGSVSGQT